RSASAVQWHDSRKSPRTLRRFRCSEALRRHIEDNPGRAPMHVDIPRRVCVPSIATVSVIAIAYWAIGKLALLLAIPPGYATAVWPPAGIALAAFLVYGARVWPGIVLGSFLVNVWTAFDPTNVFSILQSVALPASIGFGAALQ